ncbi:MAG: methyltransferase domain-containing protein [Nitrospinae bacterium]|nr:methyltransferase domain-containing protein [Nitrospinota bacterium]
MTSAEQYAASVDAVNAQRDRLQGEQLPDDRWGGETVQRFRYDPRRSLDANLEAIASYVQREEVLIDVGGGAGRLSLPLALRCREVVNVDASAGMLAAFEELAAGAGIQNARAVKAEWLAAEDIHGDVILVSNVTYFVRDIVPFVQKLEGASRRRVIILVWSEPPPNLSSSLFRLVYGEELEPSPGHRALLPVLWDMGILPDVRVLPMGPTMVGLPPDVRYPRTYEEAMAYSLAGRWLSPRDRDRARGVIEAHFQELFEQTSEGFRPLWLMDTRELLITWEPHTP